MGVRNRDIARQARDAKEEERAFLRLVKRAIHGDDDALYSLCEQIAGRVFFLASHILRDPADAEDVSQEAMIRVCEKIGKLRSPEAFWAWLSKIVANEARLHFRRNAEHGVVLNVDDYLESIAEKDEELLPQEYAESAELRQTVLGMIDGLPARQREAVLLHYYGGLSVNELAAEMGIDHSSASKYLSLAKEKLRLELERCPPGAVSMCSAGALPLSALMADVMKREAAGLQAADEEWRSRALVKCRELIRVRPRVTKPVSAARTLFWPVVGLLSAAVVFAGVYWGIERYGSLPLMNASAADPDAAGWIDFSGGESPGGFQIARNPAEATPTVNSTYGAMTALEWYITPADGEERLYSGEGMDVGDALIRLRESGPDGRYTLHMLFEDGAGSVYRVYESFLIESGT